MWTDPIVEEVRQIKQKIAAECNYDLKELYRRLKADELASGRTFVSFPPRPAIENPSSDGTQPNDCRDDTASPQSSDNSESSDNSAGKLPAADREVT